MPIKPITKSAAKASEKPLKTAKPQPVKVDLRGNRMPTPEQIEQWEADNTARVIQEVEEKIAAGKITGERLAAWRAEHPEPSAPSAEEKVKSMPKMFFAGSRLVFDESSNDYPNSNQTGKVEVIEGIIPEGVGQEDKTITNGLKKQVVGWNIPGATEDSLVVINAEIINNTTLRVYSSLGPTDPGTPYTISLQFK